MKKYLDINQAAELLGVKVGYLYARTRKGAVDPIPFYKMGRYVRFAEDELHAWMKTKQSNSAA